MARLTVFLGGATVSDPRVLVWVFEGTGGGGMVGLIAH